MTKQELVRSITQSLGSIYPGYENSALMVRVTLETLGEVAAAELLGGGEVPLPGLGKLKSRDVAARKGRNPRTGETLDIPAHKAVMFAACKDLKEAMKP